MRIVTANLGRGVSTDTFRANVRRLVTRCRGAVICFQEVDEADLPPERRILGLRMRSSWWFAGRRTKVMVAVPKTWSKVEERVRKMCSGLEGVTPDRLLLSVLIKSRIRSKLHPVAVMNAHLPYVPPSLKGQKRAVAMQKWNECWAAVKEEARYWADERNVTVFITMDANKVKTGLPHPDARVLVGEHGIDKIWVVERTVDVKKLAEGTVDLTIDGHNAHVARVALS